MRSGRRRRNFVDRDAHQPGIELRLSLELFQVGVGLEERILHHIFRVLAVLRDVLRNAKYVPVVTPDQFLERAYISALGGLNQRQLIADRFTYIWLDGCHLPSDATIFAPCERGQKCYFTW
jgi:hypothetical protein